MRLSKLERTSRPIAATANNLEHPTTIAANKIVFVAYSRPDESLVTALVAALRATGVTVLWEHDIPGGVDRQETIARWIEEAMLFVALLTEHSVGDVDVKNALLFARHLGHRCLPLRIGSPELPGGLRLELIRTEIKSFPVMPSAKSLAGCVMAHLVESPPATIAPSERVEAEPAEESAFERRAFDELIRVFHEHDRAVLLATRAGFPRSRVPAFSRALSFWHEVLDEARNGVLKGGVRRIIAEAAKLYPNNPVFARGTTHSWPTHAGGSPEEYCRRS